MGLKIDRGLERSQDQPAFLKAIGRGRINKSDPGARQSQSADRGRIGGFDHDLRTHIRGFKGLGHSRPGAIFGCERQERHAIQIPRMDIWPIGERMIRRDDADRAKAGESTVIDARQVHLIGRQADIELAVDDQIAHGSRGRDLKRDRDLRIVDPEYANGARDQG